MLLTFILVQNHSFFAHILHLLHDGGLFFMLPILVSFFVIIFLIIKNGLIIRKKKKSSAKQIKLINSIGLMILVWGVLGQLLGLVEALDRVEMLDDVSTEILAVGLKLSSLPTIFGSFVFVISRIATIVFVWFEKEV